MNRATVLAEWRKATESLGATEMLAREGYHADAVPRASYAIPHAAKAALQVHEVAVESQAATWRLFDYHFVRTGKMKAEWSAFLAEGREERLAAD